MHKSSLRSKYRKIILGITNKPEQSETISKSLIARIAQISPTSVLLYYPIENEVNISKVITYCWKNGIGTYFPFTIEQQIGLISGFDEFRNVGKYFEPQKTTKFDDIDCVIVPGLAFDKNGNRLGQGKGWYDRFLEKNNVPQKIGVCFMEQICETVPVDLNDVQMDLVIYS